MFSMQHFGQIADIAHFHFFSFSTAMASFTKLTQLLKAEKPVVLQVMF